MENPDAHFGYVRDVDTIGFAKFHNFKKKASMPEPLEKRSIQRFYLFRSGYEVGLGLNPIFCCLYKKYGTPENPEPQYARQCQYYRDDNEQIDEVRRLMPPIVVASGE